MTSPDKNKQKIAIATLDPENKGGILTMVRFAYDSFSRNGYEPFLVYNSISRQSSISLPELLAGKRPRNKSKEQFGMRGWSIDRVFPELEFFHYIFNLSLWREAMAGANHYFGVAGTNLCCLPFALLGKKFSLWVASPFKEDRIDRIEKESLIRKIRDYFSLPFLFFIERYVFKKADRIFALSEYTKRKIVQQCHIAENKISIMSMPIETDIFTPIPFGKRRKDYLLFVGRFADPRKNTEMLIRAFQKLASSFPQLRLKLIGDKPTSTMIALTQQLNVHNKIDFVDFIERAELSSVYQNAVLFVIPSHQEGLCIVGLESMACGVPVISTRCGGPEEFIKHSKNGWLIESNNEEELYRTIKEALENPKDIERIGNQARQTIEEKYSSLKINKQFDDFLKINYELPR